MGKIVTLKKVLREGPASFFRASFDKLRYCTFFHLMSDESFIKLVYWVHFGKKLNLNNPKTFNEKLQWLKLYNRKEIYTTIVDKYAVKQFIEEKIGSQYVIPKLGKWSSFEEINFDSLPRGFVLKCNHDSGSVIVCKNKDELDIQKAQSVLSRGLKQNLYWWGREFPYKNVKPCIFAEQLLKDSIDGDLKDYKFFCFNGKVSCFKVDFDRFVDHKANYYDPEGNLLKIGEKVCPPDYRHEIDLPLNLPEMIRLAEKLSQNEPFLRVDFYSVNDKIYFGELTFFPASGFGPFLSVDSDIYFGSLIILPKMINDEDINHSAGL